MSPSPQPDEKQHLSGSRRKEDNMDYKERIDYIANKLDELDIPYTVKEWWEGYRLLFPWCDGDIACNDTTYGKDDDCVESCQLPWDHGDVTCLELDEAIEYIMTFYTFYLIRGDIAWERWKEWGLIRGDE